MAVPWPCAAVCGVRMTMRVGRAPRRILNVTRHLPARTLVRLALLLRRVVSVTAAAASSAGAALP
ncbi:MAG TPA: hypothetical protein VGR12_00365, partial [Solirubrobacteraceae bacterium]|nr:hypothetical protein [Solirubrobacteraceae bacterium]